MTVPTAPTIHTPSSSSSIFRSVPPSLPQQRLAVTSLAAASNDHHHHHQHHESDDIQHNEEDELGPQVSEARRARLARESHNSKRFATGDELKNLRVDLETLKHNLEWAKALKDDVRMESLEKAIRNGQNRDPSFMYTKALKLIAHTRKLKDVSQEEKDALVEKWTNVAAAARELLPEFNLDGLWVGKYVDLSWFLFLCLFVIVFAGHRLGRKGSPTIFSFSSIIHVHIISRSHFFLSAVLFSSSIYLVCITATAGTMDRR